MRLGLVTPIVNLNPRFEPPAWEVEGGIDDVVVVARAAEALGYAFVGCPEHVAVPAAAAGQRGGRYWDPVATLSYLAAQTSTIRLLSHVVVLGYHHPLAVVKRYGTIDMLSGGRLVLGVGVGSLRGEFRLLGADFDHRGQLADEALATIRASWGQRTVTVDGPDGRTFDWIVEPSGASELIPIWVGGMTRRSLRRALELGDGWIPFGLTRDALAELLSHPGGGRARATTRVRGRAGTRAAARPGRRSVRRGRNGAGLRRHRGDRAGPAVPPFLEVALPGAARGHAGRAARTRASR